MKPIQKFNKKCYVLSVSVVVPSLLSVSDSSTILVNGPCLGISCASSGLVMSGEGDVSPFLSPSPNTFLAFSSSSSDDVGGGVTLGGGKMTSFSFWSSSAMSSSFALTSKEILRSWITSHVPSWNLTGREKTMPSGRSYQPKIKRVY